MLLVLVLGMLVMLLAAGAIDARKRRKLPLLLRRSRDEDATNELCLWRGRALRWE